MPISVLIVVVLGIIVVSYRQTIRAYPNGGGSYIVARENLGTRPGLVAAAALLTDYVLTVSVSVAAGIAAITSAFPGALDGLRVELAAVSIVLVMLINLRGVRESGTIFAIPTYVFVGSMLVLIGGRHRADRCSARRRRSPTSAADGADRDARPPAPDARLRRRVHARSPASRPSRTGSRRSSGPSRANARTTLT